MSVRAKKTLGMFVRSAFVASLLVLLWRVRGASWSYLAPWVAVYVVVALTATGYTWWWHGNSERAVASRSKADAAKAASTGTGHLAGVPQSLRVLGPDKPLKGWYLPLLFAVLSLVLWGSGAGGAWSDPHRQTFWAVCFATVSGYFVLMRLWVGRRVKRMQSAG